MVSIWIVAKAKLPCPSSRPKPLNPGGEVDATTPKSKLNFWCMSAANEETEVWGFEASKDDFSFGVAVYKDAPKEITLTTKVELAEYATKFSEFPYEKQHDLVYLLKLQLINHVSKTAGELLGHSDLASTQIYVATSQERMADAIKKLDGKDSVKELRKIYNDVVGGKITEDELVEMVQELVLSR